MDVVPLILRVPLRRSHQRIERFRRGPTGKRNGASATTENGFLGDVAHALGSFRIQSRAVGAHHQAANHQRWTIALTIGAERSRQWCPLLAVSASAAVGPLPPAG